MALIRNGWLRAAILVTLLFAVALPALDVSRRPDGELAAMAAGDPVQLGDGNLVDELNGLPLTLPIGRAGWSDGALSLDLQVTDSAEPPEEIGRNIAAVLDFAFGRTGNVDQVLLRLIAEDKWLGTERLLLAADVRRDAWDESVRRSLLALGGGPVPEPLRIALRLRESELWKDAFSSPRNGY